MVGGEEEGLEREVIPRPRVSRRLVDGVGGRGRGRGRSGTACSAGAEEACSRPLGDGVLGREGGVLTDGEETACSRPGRRRRGRRWRAHARGERGRGGDGGGRVLVREGDGSGRVGDDDDGLARARERRARGERLSNFLEEKTLRAGVWKKNNSRGVQVGPAPRLCSLAVVLRHG